MDAGLFERPPKLFLRSLRQPNAAALQEDPFRDLPIP